MDENYLGEIRLFAFSRAPRGWMLCDGRILNIVQYQALYSLLGNQFGGSAPTTFALPDLRGRTPIHFGQSTATSGSLYAVGAIAGAEAVALTAQTMPTHQHTLRAVSVAGTTGADAGDMFAIPTDKSATQHPIYGPATGLVTLNSATLSTAGQTATHNNMQPWLALNFCIATLGLYPPRA